MSRRLPVEDTKPWYKQFWPWFIIALPASVVVAGITTVYIAYEGADDLVATEYYKDGLAINRRLESKQLAEDLGIEALIKVSGDNIEVDTTVQAEHLKLLLSHPLESNRDFEVNLIQSTPGHFIGRLQAQVSPRWHWALILPVENGWRLDGRLSDSNFAPQDSD